MSGQVKIVGILNATPDSFSGDGIYMDPELAYKRTLEIFEEGANIVDIGGEATNPNAEPITAQEEWQRLQPIIERVLPRFNDRVSIDSRNPGVIERAAAYGKFIVNDITTFQNPRMIYVAAKHRLRCIASHLPLVAEGDIRFTHDYLAMNNLHQVRDELLRQKRLMKLGGISGKNIILDPGIGFGKDMVRNWAALRFADYMPRHPLMIGYSHKRFLATDPESGLLFSDANRYDVNTNLAAAKIAIDSAERNRSVLYLRVHEVKQHSDLLKNMASSKRKPAQ